MIFIKGKQLYVKLHFIESILYVIYLNFRKARRGLSRFRRGAVHEFLL